MSSLSFQSVAASSSNNSPFGQKTTNQSQQGFEGAGSKLFVSQSSADEEYEEEDGPHFEPIISLPDKIEVKTGEENEEALFSQRAKLYRYVAEEKQWKERGVGDIKLLRNNVTGKMRVLMRREQVLKLCANHQITADMKLMPNEGSDRSWVWSTSADFSEDECKAERLAVRFKNEDIAQLFKMKFEECQQNLKDHVSMNPPVQEETKEDKVEQEEDLFAKFKAPEGSWDCEMCFVKNRSEKMTCVACSNPKRGSGNDEEGTSSGKPQFPFGFGAMSSGSEVTFGSAAPPSSSRFTVGSIAPSSNLAEMPASVTSMTSSGFTFGNMKASSGSEVVASPFGVTHKFSGRITFGSGGATVEAKSFNSNSETAFVNLTQEGNIPEARIQKDEDDNSKAGECIGGEQPKAEEESHENKTGDDKREESEAAKERYYACLFFRFSLRRYVQIP